MPSSSPCAMAARASACSWKPKKERFACSVKCIAIRTLQQQPTLYLRMLHKMGLAETSLPVDKKLKRRVTADSWFASRKTVNACKEELGTEFTGPVKTATRGFPAEAMRWTLADMERGDHVVFKEEGKNLWAVGWVDVHYKLYLTTHGRSSAGEPASKKRQRVDGRNYRIQVPRPKIIEDWDGRTGITGTGRACLGSLKYGRQRNGSAAYSWRF